jgi:chromate reductase
MATIIGIAGSTRTASFNTTLLRAAAELIPVDCHLEIASIKDIPLCNSEFEASDGITNAVVELKGASKVFDASGKMVDDQIKERLQRYMSDFAAFVVG